MKNPATTRALLAAAAVLSAAALILAAAPGIPCPDEDAPAQRTEGEK